MGFKVPVLDFKETVENFKGTVESTMWRVDAPSTSIPTVNRPRNGERPFGPADRS